LRGIFDFEKNILLQPSRTYFHVNKKGFLNSQAVRIRVNVFDMCSFSKVKAGRNVACDLFFFIDDIVAGYEIPFTDTKNINEKPIDSNSDQSFKIKKLCL
jgi:hypothetical protein